MKHKEHGNKYFSGEDQQKLESEGWVRWPRTKEQKESIVMAQAKTVEQVEVIQFKRTAGRPRKA